MRRPKTLHLAALSIIGALATTRVDAHPHAWIDVSVQVLFNDSNQVSGLRETWLFDEYYTAFAMEGLGKPGAAPSQSDINDLVRENMKNLAEYTYFTTAKHGDVQVEFSAATVTSSAMSGNRLEMSFVLPFKEPIDMDHALFEYAVYDPTYFIEMLHAESDDAIRFEGPAAGCIHRLIKPTPTLEAVALAAALDRNQSGGDGLGALFAERVEIRCQ